MIKPVNTKKCAQPIGPFSQGVVVGDWVYVSGMGGLDPETGRVVSMDLKEQTVRAMENVKAILEAAGADFSQVVKATVYLTDMAQYPAVNEIYASYMGDHRPARCCVAVKELPANEIMKLDLVAYTGA